MNIPKLKIGNITSNIPIVQGGMGVRVSLSSLAAAVANEGGIGTISSIGLGDMEVLSNSEDLIRTAVKEGIKMIVIGAGLPLKLPAIVEDNSVNLVPIVSSGRAPGIILRVWDRRYGRTADGFILEGPLAGGHLGFSNEQLDQIDDYSLEKLLPDVLSAIKSYEEKYDKKIPVIVGGGIFDGKDIARMLSLGA